MRFCRAILVAVLVLAVGSSAALAAEQSFEQLLDQLLPGMGAEKIPDRQAPQQTFQNACFQVSSPGNEAARAAACRAIASKLGPETAKPARIWLLKQLEFMGGEECVDAVAALLAEKDPDVRDAARRALENNPARSVNDRLLAVVKTAEGLNWRVALVNSVGSRRDLRSVSDLALLLTDKQPAVVAAAANALGKIGASEALKPALMGPSLRKTEPFARVEAVNAHIEKLPPALCARIADAFFRSIDKLTKEGKAKQAADVFSQFDQFKLPRPSRLAAQQGMLNALGDRAAPVVIAMLGSKDKDTRQIAAGFIVNVSGPEAMKAFAEAMPKLPPDGQALLLAGLAAKGDKAAMPVVLAAVGSDRPEVELAAFQALARLGDVSVVPLLIKTMFSDSPAAGHARASLEMVYGPGADEAVIAAMRAEKDTARRGTLIDVLAKRKTVAAAPALLEEAQGSDKTIRAKAIDALANLGEPKDVPALIKMLLAAKDSGEQDKLERTVWLICKRIGDPEKRAQPVLPALKGAGDADLGALLPLLGRIGGKAALAAVKPNLTAKDPKLREAAVRALCNWPDDSVAGELLDIAKNPGNDNEHVWALRAYIRVITMRESNPNKQTLTKFDEVMKLAKRDEERNLLLSRASVIRDVATLRWLLPYLDQPALATQAGRAVVELAHHRGLMQPNHDEFMAALKKVTEVCKDKGIVDRAKRYMEGL